MNVNKLKPWRAFVEQLAMLKDRDMQVDNDDSALNYLARIGYYRLSGYWYPMRIIDTLASTREGKPIRLDTFFPNSRFEDVVKLYVFDKKLRLLALDALERIEMAVRVDVAHILGSRDPCAHENPACLHGNFVKRPFKNGPNAGKTEHQLWLNKYYGLLNRARREPFVIHHKQAYGGKLPIWVAIEVWDFGLLSKLFSGMRFDDQNNIAAKYGARDGKTFASWLRSLNFIRNVAAHHNRLWNINVLELSPVPAGWPTMPTSKAFFYFCLMQHFLQVICPHSTWGQRFKALLINEFPVISNQSASLTDIGTFEKWEKWDLWQQK